MILDMNLWRNRAEERFWLESYADLVMSDRKIINLNTRKQLQMFSDWLMSKGYKIICKEETVVIEISNEDYMLMVLKHEDI